MDAAALTAPAALVLGAWAIEAAVGWPNWLFARIRHPVVWLGWLISAFERALNRCRWPHRVRYVAGVAITMIVLNTAAGAALLISAATPNTVLGYAIDAIIASSLLASRSLYEHVAAVATALSADDLAGARSAVSKIVGRDPKRLDEAGIARASLESLAENASDGVVAPLFWGAVFGLPGIAAYKAINTLDSMIGHKNERYAAFGGFAARLDDIANLVPARLTGLLFAATSLKRNTFAVMFRDARCHRSLNAGWPEAAMAGGLGVRLSGPRAYGVEIADEPWLNGDARDPDAATVHRGLTVYVRAMTACVALLLLLLIVFWR